MNITRHILKNLSLMTTVLAISSEWFEVGGGENEDDKICIKEDKAMT